MTQSTKKAGSELLEIFYRITNFWLLYLVSLVTALVVAFAYVRYTERVYSVSTSVLLRDETSKNNNLEGLFKDLGIATGKKNLENEIALLKSHKLILKAINRLNFNIFYYAEGNIRTSEIYRKNPFSVQIDTIKEEFVGTPFYIQKLNDREYHLHTAYEKEFFDPQTHKFSLRSKDNLPSRSRLQFGVSYAFSGTRFTVDSRPELIEEYNPNTLFYFVFNLPDDLADAYGGRLNVKQVNKLSTILELSIRGKVVEKESDFLNSLVAVYTENILEEKNKVAGNTIKFIDQQLSEITVSLQEAEEELKYFRANNKIMDLSFAATNAFSKLDALESEKAQITVKRKYYDYLLNYIRSNDVMKDVVAPSSIGIDDPLLTSLIQQLSKLTSDKSVLSLSAKEKNPAWFILEDKINSIKKELIENIKGIIANSQIASDELQRRIAVLEKSVNELPDNERRLVNIQRKFNLSDNIYTYLLQKRAEAGIAMAANLPDCQVVEEASLRAASLVAPKKSVVFAIALFVGLLLPTLIALARIWLNDKIISREDLENNTEIPIVGMVGNNANVHNLVTITSPRGPVTEDFRSIKLNLPYMQPNRELKVIVVTSSVPGEGKTFCSVNLASVYAMSGKRTLVLFADLRRPRIDKELAINPDIGLSNVLIGKENLMEVVQESAVKNLFVLASGPTPPNPAELLGTQKMDEVIQVLRQHFDTIIIDTPPLGLVADSLLLIKHSDAICYIVRHNYTRKLFLRKINEMYEEHRIKNICIIINDIEGETVGYGYGYGYRYGGYGYSYGYFEEEAQPFWKRLSGNWWKRERNA